MDTQPLSLLKSPLLRRSHSWLSSGCTNTEKAVSCHVSSARSPGSDSADANHLQTNVTELQWQCDRWTIPQSGYVSASESESGAVISGSWERARGCWFVCCSYRSLFRLHVQVCRVISAQNNDEDTEGRELWTSERWGVKSKACSWKCYLMFQIFAGKFLQKHSLT